MTMTIKLAPDMELRLRRRSEALGLPASALIREALAQYLDASSPVQTSPYALGSDVFGRFRGDVDLAAQRKKHIADAWAEKHAARRR